MPQVATPHALRRLYERYGLCLGPSDLFRIRERALAQSKQGLAIRLTATRSLCPVEWEGAVLNVVMSRKSKIIVTFLPPIELVPVLEMEEAS